MGFGIQILGPHGYGEKPRNICSPNRSFIGVLGCFAVGLTGEIRKRRNGGKPTNQKWRKKMKAWKLVYFFLVRVQIQGSRIVRMLIDDGSRARSTWTRRISLFCISQALIQSQTGNPR